jgi:hypothetical protein
MRQLLVVSTTLAIARASSAQPALPSDSWAYTAAGDLAIDAGLVVGFPAALPTGLSKGIGAGATWGRGLAVGARASWATATESTMTWEVTHSDLRLRATGALQHVAGRGTFGLRLALGGTLVHESRLRNQGKRAGLTGSELETSTFALLPAADVEAVIALHVFGPWAMALSGGPSFAVVDGAAHTSWTAQLGVAWQR